MSQNVLIGTLGQSLTGLYGGTAGAAISYEEGATNGFGVRMTSVRQYHNWFTQAFAAAGDDEGFFKSGHSVVSSVSNPQKVTGSFSFGLMASGTYNTDIDAMFDRIFALPFDSAVAGGSAYGGFTQPYVYLILQHEIDRGNLNGANKLPNGSTAADFIAAWQLLWTRCGLRATAAGKPRSRVRFCWNITGFNISRSDPYYPGAAYVDVIGVDPYSSPGTSFASLNSSIWPYIRAKNKPMCYPETNNVRTNFSDSAVVQSYWADVATQINALDISVEFLNIFLYPDSTVGYAINKLAAASAGGHAYPLIHAGIATMISNLGNNAIIGSVGQALPAAPTGLSIASAVNGLSAAGSWSANAGGDNVTGWKLYQANGNVGSGGTVVGTLNAATPRTFTFPNLTPGNTYTGWVAAINSKGQGPVSAPFSFQAAVPSGGNNPAISAATAIVEAGNAQGVDFTAAATSPLSRPLTYSWSVAQNGVVVDAFNGTSLTRSYTSQGNYNWTLTVADNGTPALTTTATGSFAVVLSAMQTPMNGWDLTNFQPGAFVELIGKGLLPIFADQDAKIGGLLGAHGDVADILGGSGQTFDPALSLSTNQFTASVSTVLWAKLKCRSGTITALNTFTTQAQIGTGAKVAICDATGNVLTVDGTIGGATAIFSGTNVDAWLTATAGDTTYVLDTAISGITPGSIITIQVFWPSSGVTQYPKIIAAPCGNTVAKASGNSTIPRWGSATGQSDIGNPVPFAPYTACPLPYFEITP